MSASKKIILLTIFLIGFSGFSCNRYRGGFGENSNGNTSGDQEQTSEQFVRVNFLDVGQGDAALIDFPSGEQMLVDCGVNARILPALGQVMKPFDREINYLVVTHPDMDHYGGCADVLERFKVDKIFFTGVEKPDNYWKYFWELAHKEGEYAQVGAESELDIGKTKINFFYPDHDVTSDKKVPGQKKSSGDNDTSIVFKLAFGRAAALFTGDSGISLEKYLIGKYDKELKSSVLKVGHHGSAGSSSQEFLDAVKPEVAVISVGKDNKYGHPSLRALKRLQRSEAKILRTDEKGSIILKMYENGKVEVAD